MKKTMYLLLVLSMVLFSGMMLSCSSGGGSDTTYTVSFAANGGTGTMGSITVDRGEWKVPGCTFTAPSMKEFKCWNDGIEDIKAGAMITVNRDITLTAQWTVDLVALFIVLQESINNMNTTIDGRLDLLEQAVNNNTTTVSNSISGLSTALVNAVGQGVTDLKSAVEALGTTITTVLGTDGAIATKLAAIEAQIKLVADALKNTDQNAADILGALGLISDAIDDQSEAISDALASDGALALKLADIKGAIDDLKDAIPANDDIITALEAIEEAIGEIEINAGGSDSGSGSGSGSGEGTGGGSGSGSVPTGAVDLGLSVYWAEKDIGAGTPEILGSLILYGEAKSIISSMPKGWRLPNRGDIAELGLLNFTKHSGELAIITSNNGNSMYFPLNKVYPLYENDANYYFNNESGTSTVTISVGGLGLKDDEYCCCRLVYDPKLAEK